MSVERARQLRKTMTAPEARLWNALRQLRAFGHHFRRQVPIGRYYVDFCCHKSCLIIEVDGDTHFETAAIAYDGLRDDLLRREGYRVLRTTNHEVMWNLDGVMSSILSELDQPPPSLPPHKGEGSLRSGLRRR